MIETLQPYFGAKIIDLKKETILPEVLELVPEAYAKSKSAVLFSIDKENKIAKLAMLDPIDYETIEFLRANLGYWVEPYLTTPTSLKYGLKFYKKKMGAEFNKIISENIEKSFSLANDIESGLARMAESVPIVAILDSVIEHAVVLGASDIHFEPMAESVLIRYRVAEPVTQLWG